MICFYITILAQGYCPSQTEASNIIFMYCLHGLSLLESEEYVMLKLGNWACRKEKDPLKPKHPTTAFFAFSNSRRPALLEAKKPVTEVPTWLFVNFVLDFYASTNVCALSVMPCCFWTSFEYLELLLIVVFLLHLSYYLSHILKNLSVPAD